MTTANDIGWAVKEMWDGRKVRRAGWNGKGMWLRLVREWGFSGHTGHEELPFVVMKTGDDKLVPWLCSQTDLLATDWEIVE